MPTGRFHVPLRVCIVFSSIFVVWTLFRWRYGPFDELNARVPILKGEDLTKPPIYPALLERERRMPQNDEDAPPPNGRSAKFLRFGNQMWSVGLNNQLQEVLLNSYIAFLTGRSYVFTPFTWDLIDTPYVPLDDDTRVARINYGIRPTHIPMTAYLNSPTSGAPWRVDSSMSAEQVGRMPRAISLEYWDKVCPSYYRYLVNTTEIGAKIGVNFNKDEGAVIVSKWVDYFKTVEDQRCIMVLWDTPRIIDFGILGSERLLSLWSAFSKSPILTQFKWSPIVLGAVKKNLRMLLPPSRTTWSFQTNEDQFHEIPGLVTLHIRRGDYESHCKWLSTFASFEGWSRLPFLADPWSPPQASDARRKYALDRCWVEIPAILSRLETVRRQHSELQLDRIFLASNGKPEWLVELKDGLAKHGWNTIVSTRDLDLNWQENGVENAVDIELAARGQVFIGNGFSSFTSTIVSMRMVRGLAPKNTYLW